LSSFTDPNFKSQIPASETLLQHIFEFQAQLAARRARRAAEVQKAVEKRRIQKAKEDEEKRLEELARIREEEEAAREAEEDGLDVPDVLVMDNLEVQVIGS